MPIVVCGINHKTAPLALREKVMFPLEKLSFYLADLRTHTNIQDAVILSTCNRSELYCDAENAEEVKNWFCRQHPVASTDLASALSVLQGAKAIEHIMQVACGLDSMILGESQILGQMKTAFSESCAAGTIGPLFNRLFQHVFAVAKEVRTTTSIGACPVSVASAAVSLAKQLFPTLNTATVLVMGAGDTINLVLRYLQTDLPKRLLIVNRSPETAGILAQRYNGEIFSFAELPVALTLSDVVISATGSTVPIVNKVMLEAVLTKRQGRMLTLIDIAVPRDIEASANELSAVNLFCIDDLKTIIQNNLQGREHAAEKAREVIQVKTQEFLAWLSSLDLVATTIRAYRKQVEEISQLELVKAARQLQRGDDPLQVLIGFSRSFTQKLLHTPSVQLRQAGVAGRVDILQIAQQLFAISEPQSEIL
jgi:glutamyl-tRNA reductase